MLLYQKKEITYFEALKYAKQVDNHENSDSIDIRLISNLTIDALGTYLQAFFLSLDVKAKICKGDYGALVQSSFGVKSGEISIIYYDINEKYKDLRLKHLESKEVQEAIDSAVLEVNTIISNCRPAAKTFFILGPDENNFCSVNGIDSISAVYQAIQKVLQSTENNIADSFCYVDVQNLSVRYNGLKIYNHKDYKRSKVPLTLSMMEALGRHIVANTRRFLGKQIKAIVTDADNTLWRGIIDEVGVSGICVDKLDPKSVEHAIYNEQLKIAKNLGYVLCICSKNNPKELMKALDNGGKDMLAPEDFTLIKGSWNSKSEVILEIASTLNISHRNILFIDDNFFEIHEVTSKLKGINAIHFEPNESTLQLIKSSLFDDKYFNKSISSRGDSTEMMKLNIQRNHEKMVYSSQEEYLKSLNMTMLSHVNSMELATRIAEVTQKTNQFNLSMLRYSDSQVREFMQNSCYKVIGIELSDKFGSLGLIGVAIIKKQADIFIVLGIYLSCRALGRCVENELWKRIKNEAAMSNVENIYMLIADSDRNSLALEFVQSLGVSINKSEDEINLFDNLFQKPLGAKGISCACMLR